MKDTSKLIIEPHPENYTGLPFITLLQFRKEHYLTIIDDSDDEEIKALVLDLCDPSEINKEMVLEIAIEWFKTSRHVPLSIFFSMQGLSHIVEKIYRTFNTECTTRVIGPLPRYNMDQAPVVKRKKRKFPTDSYKTDNNIIEVKF